MQYAKLGNTDVEVCKICIGGMSFGGHIEGRHLAHAGWTGESSRENDI